MFIPIVFDLFLDHFGSQDELFLVASHLMDLIKDPKGAGLDHRFDQQHKELLKYTHSDYL